MVAYALKGQGIKKKKKKRGGVTFMCNKVARILQASPPLCKNASHCTPNNKSSVTIGKYSMVTLVLGAMIVFMKHIFFFFVFLNQCCILNWFGLNKTAKILLWDRERERKKTTERKANRKSQTSHVWVFKLQCILHIHKPRERERQAKARYSSFPHCVNGFVLPRTPNQPSSRWFMHVKKKQL